ALVREINEELGCRVAASSARPLGVFDAAAANEPGILVRAAVYAVDVEGAIAAGAEVEEVVWVDPRALPELPFAPLTRGHLLPLAWPLAGGGNPAGGPPELVPWRRRGGIWKDRKIKSTTKRAAEALDLLPEEMREPAVAYLLEQAEKFRALKTLI